MKMLAFSFIVGLLLLTACGQMNRDDLTEEANSDASLEMTQSAMPEAAETDPHEIEPSITDDESSTTEELTTDGIAEVEDAEIAKTYHMNKVFSIVPNDPDGEKKVVLLTFDDGPKKREMIEPMLDILDQHEAKAIFFVNGDMVELRPELLRLIHERGQITGNHSYNHIELKKETNEEIDRQIEDTQKIVFETIGVTPQFFRPPHASSNDYVKEKVKQEGMLFMTWSNGSLDWADNKNNPDGIIKSVLEQLGPGSNILMHELPWTVEALDELLTTLEDKGYTFVDPRAIELEMR